MRRVISMTPLIAYADVWVMPIIQMFDLLRAGGTIS
jgi:hypothetical protein